MGMPQCVFMLWRLFNASQTQQQQQQCPQMTGLSEQCGRGRGQGCPGWEEGTGVVTGPTSIAMNMIIFLTPVFIWANAEAVQAVPVSLCVRVCVRV